MSGRKSIDLALDLRVLVVDASGSRRRQRHPALDELEDRRDDGQDADAEPKPDRQVNRTCGC